jgi:aldehyde dehydrogenase (NAD+)
MLQDNHSQILTALSSDLNRHSFESTVTDIKALHDDILLAIENLEKWTADEIPEAGFIFGTLGGARIHKEPLGVTLIIGAWNFPISILLQPLVAAITAGCCAILKPSELAPACQALLVDMVPKYLDNEAIRVVTAGPVEMGFILEHKFNHIFYTGSSKVAKIIAVAAAKFLTPVTLELGGQGPAVVSKSADVDLSAKRIASSKVLNAGQICLSVNHVFCAPEIHDEFVGRLGYWFDEFLGEDKANPEHMVRIVNERNFDRLEGMLSKTEGKIVYGGITNREDKYIHPTVVTGITTSGTFPGNCSDNRFLDE